MRVLTADATFNLFEQRFSPDQRWISFIAVNASDAGVSTVYVMPAAGGAWKPITDGSTYDDKPHWAPDGRTIYFVSHRDGVLNVWGRRIDPSSGLAIGRAVPRDVVPQSAADDLALSSPQMQIAVTAGRCSCRSPRRKASCGCSKTSTGRSRAPCYVLHARATCSSLAPGRLEHVSGLPS